MTDYINCSEIHFTHVMQSQTERNPSMGSWLHYVNCSSLNIKIRTYALHYINRFWAILVIVPRWTLDVLWSFWSSWHNSPCFAALQCEFGWRLHGWSLLPLWSLNDMLWVFCLFLNISPTSLAMALTTHRGAKSEVPGSALGSDFRNFFKLVQSNSVPSRLLPNSCLQNPGRGPKSNRTSRLFPVVLSKGKATKFVRTRGFSKLTRFRNTENLANPFF